MWADVPLHFHGSYLLHTCDSGMLVIRVCEDLNAEKSETRCTKPDLNKAQYTRVDTRAGKYGQKKSDLMYFC